MKICVSRRQTPDAKPKICVSPDAKPRRQPVEYRWRWVLALGLCVGHVRFIFFVLISFALGSRRRPSFQWNMGLRGRNCHFCIPQIHSLNTYPLYMDIEVSSYFIGYHVDSTGCLATMFKFTICLATAYLERSGSQ